MWNDPVVWIGGLAISGVMLVLVVVALRRWRYLIDCFVALDESASRAEVTATTRHMERARYLTYGLALLALVPANPAVFHLILRYPKLHAILGVSGIVFVLGAALKAVTKLSPKLLFPARPTGLTILRSVAIGLCLGFVLLLLWQLTVYPELRGLVIGAWKTQ